MMQFNIESESYASSSVCSQDFPNELQAVSIGRRTSIGPSLAALLKGERRSKFPLGRSRSAILSNWRLLETTCSRPLKRMQQHNMQKYILRGLYNLYYNLLHNLGGWCTRCILERVAHFLGRDYTLPLFNVGPKKCKAA